MFLYLCYIVLYRQVTVNCSTCVCITIGVPTRAPLITGIEHRCGGIEVSWNQTSTACVEGPMTGVLATIRRSDGDWRNCNIFPSNQSCLLNGLESETDYICVQTASDWTRRTTTTGLTG